MIKGFILAAGYSKRLRPITEHIPKPLLPIAGEVLLEIIYKSLKNAKVHEIGINLHYKADEIEKYLKKHAIPIKVFHEKDILLTAGALWNAREFLKDSVFIVHNADIYWDGNIKEAIDWHINSQNSITLLVHEHPPDNKLIVDEEGNLLDVSNQTDSTHALAYSGVSIYTADVLELLPAGPSSLIELWLKAVKKGFKVKTFKAKYSFWFDVGTPSQYARAVFNKLKRSFSSVYVHKTAKGCELIECEGNVVIEREVEIKKPFKAKNLIILPETEFSPLDSYISNCIVGKNFIVPFNNLENPEELTHGGSQRKFFRKNGKVFCKWETLSQDFENTVLLGRFLKEKGFPVPEILAVENDKRLIIFEDLGNLTLYSWLQCKRKDEEIEKTYKEIIVNIVNLHWKISKNSEGLNIPQFDYSYFRWESDYFLKECVKELFRIEPVEVYEELHFIAETLSKTEKVILHRDLQSQNIMLKNGKIYFVDYQGARWGPPGYDIASLIWDPYVNLKNELRKNLVHFYLDNAEIHNNRSDFLKELSLCRIQRHMQALGAYGFLSLKRGKKSFLKFIPNAINLLMQDIEECYLELPRIRDLVLKLKNLINNGFCGDFFII